MATEIAEPEVDTTKEPEPTDFTEDTSDYGADAGSDESLGYTEGAPPEGDSLDTSPTPEGQERTYAGKYRSVEDLERGYLEAQKYMGQNSQYYQLGQMAAQDMDGFQNWYRQRQSQAAQPQQQEDVVYGWDPPVEYTPQLQDAITRYQIEKQNGADSGLTATQKNDVEKFLGYSNSKWNSYFSNPYIFAHEVVSPVIMEQVQEQIQGLKNQMWASAFIQSHQDLLQDPTDQAQFSGLLREGVPAKHAAELAYLRRQGRLYGSREAGLQARERIAENRENASKKHVKGRPSRREDMSMASLEEKYSHLEGAARAKAIAKAMGLDV